MFASSQFGLRVKFFANSHYLNLNTTQPSLRKHQLNMDSLFDKQRLILPLFTPKKRMHNLKVRKKYAPENCPTSPPPPPLQRNITLFLISPGLLLTGLDRAANKFSNLRKLWLLQRQRQLQRSTREWSAQSPLQGRTDYPYRHFRQTSVRRRRNQSTRHQLIGWWSAADRLGTNVQG